MGRRILVAGTINTDLVARTRRAPEAGETITGLSFDIFGGGKGANQAVAAARAGGDVFMLSGVGDDDFGRRLAETFARAGASVFAGMRDPGGRNAKVRAELEVLGLLIEVLALDVTDDAQVDAAVARVIDRHGRIDVLINNAGGGLAALSECSTVEQARQVFETNYFGPVRMCRAVLPHMRKQRSGFIVHMGSIGGSVALPNSAHYGAAKSALVTRSGGR